MVMGIYMYFLSLMWGIFNRPSSACSIPSLSLSLSALFLYHPKYTHP